MSAEQIEQDHLGTGNEGMDQTNTNTPPAGLKTSDVYQIKNIPERFNNPGEYMKREREREREREIL